MIIWTLLSQVKFVFVFILSSLSHRSRNGTICQIQLTLDSFVHLFIRSCSFISKITNEWMNEWTNWVSGVYWWIHLSVFYIFRRTKCLTICVTAWHKVGLLSRTRQGQSNNDQVKSSQVVYWSTLRPNRLANVISSFVLWK